MSRTRFALLLGTTLLAGIGVAFAQMEGPRDASGSGQERMGSRFFSEYDLNHDGKVTRDEMNRVLAQRFGAAAKGGAMTLDQFNASRMGDFRRRVDQMFRRVDWNSDGRISQDEYLASERSYFASLDRDGTGVVACSGAARSAQGERGASSGRSRRGGGRGRGSRAQFCADNDLNKDGQVTRAEFDKAAMQRFAAAAKGGSLNGDGFYRIALARFQQSNARYFQRIDTDHNGTLSLAEYSANAERMFARADKNNDGAIERNEIGRRSDYRRAQGGKGKPGPRAPG